MIAGPWTSSMQQTMNDPCNVLVRMRLDRGTTMVLVERPSFCLTLTMPDQHMAASGGAHHMSVMSLGR